VSQDHRHPLPLERPPQASALAQSHRAAVSETLDRLARAPARPRAMQPFDDLFRGDWRWEELRGAPRPVVGSLCNFVPEELVLAAGAIPLRVDLSQAAAAQAGGRVLPADVCPVVKAMVGAHLLELPALAACDLLVIPTACDGKRKLVRLLGEEREGWRLELPADKSVRSRSRWRDEVTRLAGRLEQLTGKRLARRALREAVTLVGRRTELVRRVNQLRQEHASALGGSDALLWLQASFIADARWWVARTEALLEELNARVTGEEQARPEDGRLRLLLTGSPILFPDLRLLHLIEEPGRAVVVADDLCSGTERLYHPTTVDEWTAPGLVRAAADRTLLPCTCPCFVGVDDRIDRLLALCREARVSGVIHHTLRLCQPYDLDQARVSAALKRAGIPVLHLYLEPGTEDTAMLQNRIEAFLEMLAQ